jgi:RNA recognition motif-containing protein
MVRTKVFVGNLSFQTKETELASEFAAAGTVISANIITRGPRSLGYGFVELDSEEDAQNAVKLLNKKEINGRPINVEVAKPRDETKERAPRAEGENGAPPRRRPRRKSVRKEGEEEEEHKQTEKDGKKEESDDAKPRRRPRPKRYRRTGGENGSPRERQRVPNEEKEESKTTLFVANLPFSLDDAEFGKIVSDLNLKLKTAHVVKKRNGRSKGYGFIEFESQEDQQKALAALNKKVVDSRELSVKVALTELKRNDQVEEQKTPAPAPVPEKKTVTPVAEKKATPAEKKTASPVAAEKKTAPAAEKKTASPTPAKETKPSEKKTASPAPAKETKASEKAPEKTPEKKTEEKK